MMTNTFKLIGGFLAIFAFAACSSNALPTKGNYTVTTIDAVAVQAPASITAVIEDGRLAGRGPVNNWSLPVGDDGKLGLGISTRMAGPESLMVLENKLLSAFDGGKLEARSHGKLVVVKDGKEAVVLVPVSSAGK